MIDSVTSEMSSTSDVNFSDIDSDDLMSTPCTSDMNDDSDDDAPLNVSFSSDSVSLLHYWFVIAILCLMKFNGYIICFVKEIDRYFKIIQWFWCIVVFRIRIGYYR